MNYKIINTNPDYTPIEKNLAELKVGTIFEYCGIKYIYLGVSCGFHQCFKIVKNTELHITVFVGNHTKVKLLDQSITIEFGNV